MKTQDIQNLTEDQLKELMYNICRSGRVIIPQYYRGEHVKNFTGKDPSTDDMLVIQSSFESDWSTHEYLDNAIGEIVWDNNFDDCKNNLVD